jgi:hypothetical protein
VLYGRVRNIRIPSDVAGIYAAAGAGLALGGGVRAIVLANQKGAVLVGPTDRADGERRPERACDHDAVAGRAIGWVIGGFAAS